MATARTTPDRARLGIAATFLASAATVMWLLQRESFVETAPLQVAREDLPAPALAAVGTGVSTTAPSAAADPSPLRRAVAAARAAPGEELRSDPVTHATASISGTIEGPGGQPAFAARIRVQPADAAWDSVIATESDDDDAVRRQAVGSSDWRGHFQIGRLAFGSYQVWVEADDAVPRLLPQVDARAPEDRDVGLIRLAPGVVVSGRVFVDGRLAQAGEVTCEISGDHLFGVGWEARPRQLRVRTTESGTFQLPYRLYPSQIALLAWCEDQVEDAVRQRQRAASPKLVDLVDIYTRIDMQISTDPGETSPRTRSGQEPPADDRKQQHTATQPPRPGLVRER